jgi:hypothetical protein
MRAGDVVWWHHRILHWPIHNTSESIRQAVIYDYVKRPEACPDGDDGMHVHPRAPNEGGIWSEWAEEVQRFGEEYPALPLGVGTQPACL